MDQLQSFSIIIPSHSRPGQLAASLRSLARLNYPSDRFEVIITDDGSSMPLEDVVLPYRGIIDIKLVKQAHTGPSTARNKGAAHAKGQLLAFLDDDCETDPEWLQALAARFAGTPECMVGGRTINALTDNSYSTASQVLLDYLYSYYNKDFNRSRFFTSNNLAVPAKRFHEIGGFDETYPRAAAEDRELCDRWIQYGNRLIYAPEAIVYHSHYLTFRLFCKQHFHYGRGAFCFRQVRALRTKERIKVEPLSFYLDLFIYPFSREKGQRALLLALFLTVTQAANAAGFFWEKASQKIIKLMCMVRSQRSSSG